MDKIMSFIRADFEWFMYALKNDKLGFDYGDFFKSDKKASRRRKCTGKQGINIVVQQG